MAVDDGGTFGGKREILTLTEDAGTTCKDQTEVVHGAMCALRDLGIIKGWRNEMYPVSASFNDKPPLFLLERAAAPLLGVQHYGVHVNGFVRHSEARCEDVRMWMARRSGSKSKYPGMLDHIVAGGQPFGMSPAENVVKECQEGAGITESLAKTARAAGAVSYEYYDAVLDTINLSCLFCYDLELPLDFHPTPVDGERWKIFSCGIWIAL